jgi:hypothetical protein
MKRSDLSAEDYATAAAAPLASAVVSFKGILHRLPRLNRIDRVTEFTRVHLDGDGVPLVQRSQA